MRQSLKSSIHVARIAKVGHSSGYGAGEIQRECLLTAEKFIENERDYEDVKVTQGLEEMAYQLRAGGVGE